MSCCRTKDASPQRPLGHAMAGEAGSSGRDGGDGAPANTRGSSQSKKRPRDRDGLAGVRESCDPVEAWRGPLKNAMRAVGALEGLHQVRPLRLHGACSGMQTEAHALRDLGIEVQSMYTSDPKPAAVAFAQKNCSRLSKHSEHHYMCLRDAIAGGGWCQWHASRCDVPPGQDDLCVIGFPCQPYSGQRSDRWCAGGVSQHESAWIVDAVVEHLQAHGPRMAILENVLGFAAARRGTSSQGGRGLPQSILGDGQPSADDCEGDVEGPDDEVGFSHAQSLLHKIKGTGLYHVEIVQVQLSDWVAAARARCPSPSQPGIWRQTQLVAAASS